MQGRGERDPRTIMLGWHFNADAGSSDDPQFASERHPSSSDPQNQLIGKFSRTYRRQEAIIKDISARWNARQIESFTDQLQIILELLLVDGANPVSSGERRYDLVLDNELQPLQINFPLC